MKKILIATAFAAAAFAAPASAENFSGLRAEAHIGYDHARVDIGGGDHEKANGFVYGVGAGYDIPIGQTVVLGIEANADLTTADREARDLVFPGDKAFIDVKRDLDVGARLGFRAGDRSLVYVRGGYVNGKLRAGYDDGAGGGFALSDDGDGVRVAGGVERAYGRAYAKVEYRYTNYEGGFDRHQVLGGVGIRF